MGSGSDLEEEERRLVERSRAGETAAFRPLLERYERMVRSVIYRLVGTMPIVDDLAQETFVSAFKNIRQYSGQVRFSTWLCQIAVNKSRDARRTAISSGALVSVDMDEFDAPSDAEGPEALFERRQRSAQLQVALNGLKEQDRELIVLKYLMDYSYEEVAALQHCSVAAAKVRGHRARDELKRALQRLGIET